MVRLFEDDNTRTAIQFMGAIYMARGIAMAIDKSLVEKINQLEKEVNKELERHKQSFDSIGTLAVRRMAQMGVDVLYDNWPFGRANLLSAEGHKKLVEVKEEFLHIAEVSAEALETIDKSRAERTNK